MKTTQPIIIFANGRPAYPFFVGGDGVSIHNILSGLAQQGFQCYCLGCYDFPKRELQTNLIPEYLHHGILKNYFESNKSINYDIGYHCHLVSYKDFANELIHLLENLSQESSSLIVITQLEMSNTVIQIANYMNLKLVLFVVDNTEPNNKTISLLEDNNCMIFNSIFVAQYFSKNLPKKM